MKPRLAVLALMCGASMGALGDVERDRIAAERQAANARLAARERDCETRFVVAPCVEAARTETRATLNSLRQRELALDEAKRVAAAEARRKAIAENLDAQRSRAAEAPPEPLRVHVRGVQPSARARAEPRSDSPRVPEAVPAGADANRAAAEQRNRERFEARQREMRAHREAVELRNERRAAQGRTTSPLPAPR
jgi:hypothetical protein